MSKTIPEGTPCPNCQSIDRVIREIQLNLKQWRCGQCDRFLAHISLPGKTQSVRKSNVGA